MNKPWFHGQKLRRGRYSDPNRIYFITSCCDAKAPIFKQPEYAQLVLDQSCREENTGDCKSMAIVVMPDHFHWLLQLGAGRTLQQIVASMKGTTAYKINKLRDQHKRVWQAGFHDRAVRREEHLENLAAYLLRNPVRAGIVSYYDEYPYWLSIWHQRGDLGFRA